MQPAKASPRSGRRRRWSLNLRPESPAYGTHLRLLTARIIDAANQRAGRSVVRKVRVLPAGAAAVPAPEPAADRWAESQPASPVKTRENASAGYRRPLEVLLATSTPTNGES
ncbi:DciA family protein [Streptomyces sp. NPDC006339]|uniref:DciA family protein n=1 Tax=Streptomyces sp. NPDC006339 TaxID=3156755 RepID=UPI0033AD77F1